MRRIFTLSLVAFVCLLATSRKLNAQCTTSAQSTNNTGSYKTAPTSGTFNGGDTYVFYSPVYQSTTNLSTLNFYINMEQVGNNIQTSLIPTITVKYYDATGLHSTTACTPGSGTPFTPSAGSVQPQYFSVNAPITAYNNFQIIVSFASTGTRVVNISGFGIDNTQATMLEIGQAILPVKFSNVAVRKATEGAVVTWNVGTEQNVSGYDVEKSTDARNFTKIGFVKATAQSSYSLTDAQAGSVNFYRIKSVDIDGKFGYSTVVSLNNGASSVVVKAFMSDKNTLTVQHDAAQAGSRISVISMDGRVVKVQQPAADAQQTKVDMSSAQTGLYIIRYDNGQGGTQSIKVAK